VFVNSWWSVSLRLKTESVCTHPCVIQKTTCWLFIYTFFNLSCMIMCFSDVVKRGPVYTGSWRLQSWQWVTFYDPWPTRTVSQLTRDPWLTTTHHTSQCQCDVCIPEGRKYRCDHIFAYALIPRCTISVYSRHPYGGYSPPPKKKLIFPPKPIIFCIWA